MFHEVSIPEISDSRSSGRIGYCCLNCPGFFFSSKIVTYVGHNFSGVNPKESFPVYFGNLPLHCSLGNKDVKDQFLVFLRKYAPQNWRD